MRNVHFFYHKSTQSSQRRSVGASLFLVHKDVEWALCLFYTLRLCVLLRAFVVKTIQHIIR